jgi:DNA mismatch endonuclease (patch repair protein)
MLHAAGYRFRLNVSNLPGTPDLVFPGRHKIIFVNGCFWHSHDCKYGSVSPKTNAEFWSEKRTATTARDRLNVTALESTGWKVLTVWECELRQPDKALERAREFLG